MINILVTSLIVLGIGSMVEFYTASFPLFALIAIIFGALYMAHKGYKIYTTDKETRLKNKINKEKLKEIKKEKKANDKGDKDVL